MGYTRIKGYPILLPEIQGSFRVVSFRGMAMNWTIARSKVIAVVISTKTFPSIFDVG